MITKNSAEEVGYDVAGAADEDEVAGGSGCEGGGIGFLYCRIGSALQATFLCHFSKGDRRDGPVGVGLGEIIFSILWQKGKDAADILVIDHTEDDMQRAATLAGFSLDVWGKILPRCKVMACIANNEGFLLYDLPTATKASKGNDKLQCLGYQGIGHNKVRNPREDSDGIEDGVEVGYLIAPLQDKVIKQGW